MNRIRTKGISLDPRVRNLNRARSVRSILDTFQREQELDREDVLCDLLANLMHWCDHNDQDFDVELRRAQEHHICEAAGEL